MIFMLVEILKHGLFLARLEVWKQKFQYFHYFSANLENLTPNVISENEIIKICSICYQSISMICSSGSRKIMPVEIAEEGLFAHEDVHVK